MNGKKQLIAGLLAGFLVAGGAGAALTAYADEADDARYAEDAYDAWCPGPGMMRSGTGFHGMMHGGRGADMGRQPWMMRDRYASPAAQAKAVADIYGVSASEVEKAIENEVPYRYIDRAAFLAKASGKSFQTVLDMKKDDNRWIDVEESLHIADEQYRAARADILSRCIASRCRMEANEARAFLDEGYRPMDIAIAARIAETAKVDVRKVLDAKTIKNDWEDVAASFGVDDDVIDPWDHDDMDDFDGRDVRGQRRGGHGYGYGMTGRGCDPYRR